MTFKTCTSCGVSKPLTEYHREKRASDGKRSVCKQCRKIERSDWYLSNREYHLEYYKKYRVGNKDKLRKQAKEHYQKNKDKYFKYRKEYYAGNKPKFRQWGAKYRASKTNSTPPWLTEEQKKQMEYFYWLAKDLQVTTGEAYHVDHIVPLQGKDVCGLHVPWNLQILPADVNLKKNNNFTEGDF